jgi:Rrf2 family protein
MLTAKGKYGLKAVVHLSALPAGETAQSIDIAEANNIPKKSLDAILGDLRNAGIVRTKKGPGGGYLLARAPSEIKLGHVIRTLDGPLAPIACASHGARASTMRLGDFPHNREAKPGAVRARRHERLEQLGAHAVGNAPAGIRN